MVISIKRGRLLSLLTAFVFLGSILLSIKVNAASNYNTFKPIESSKVLNNPYMGLAPDARETSYVQPHKLVFAKIKWSELEAQKGVYDFDAFEKKNNFSIWKQKNVKVIIRVILDYPTSISHKDIPDWLYNEINGDGTWYDISYGKGFSPNYENKTLISYHEKLIAALGNRYNNSNDIAFVQVGSLGHWGEWHTLQNSTIKIPFPSGATADTYVTHYINAFSNKYLMMRRPFDIAKQNNMGLFNDILGNYNETINDFLSWINKGYYNPYIKQQVQSMPDFWKTAPSGGEFASGGDGSQFLNSSQIDKTLYQARETHISWVGPNCPANVKLNSSTQHYLDTFLKAIGYRFVINQVQLPSKAAAGKSADITFTITNKGIAPFYYEWPIELSLVDSKGNIVFKTTVKEDIKTWLPGTKSFSSSFVIPSTLKSGSYKLAMAIIDPSTGNPSVDFANEGRLTNGSYSVGTITIK